MDENIINGRLVDWRRQLPFKILAADPTAETRLGRGAEVDGVRGQPQWPIINVLPHHHVNHARRWKVCCALMNCPRSQMHQKIHSSDPGLFV